MTIYSETRQKFYLDTAPNILLKWAKLDIKKTKLKFEEHSLSEAEKEKTLSHFTRFLDKYKDTEDKDNQKILKLFYGFVSGSVNSDITIKIQLYPPQDFPKDLPEDKKENHRKEYLDLPKSHTCFNTLDVHYIAGYEDFKTKLMMALKAYAIDKGFGLL
ncbi:hypothetical protein DID76_00240 [Candidatus Marinamargulisbacteria bacterium SCGC AG-414-C22]|nr:hypothetical protein DID76_00240 [Candidatus Marinamargulisbacteria bacterium SCGC AG-414-C22]